MAGRRVAMARTRRPGSKSPMVGRSWGDVVSNDRDMRARREVAGTSRGTSRERFPGSNAQETPCVPAQTPLLQIVILEREGGKLLDALSKRPDRVAAREQQPIAEVVVSRLDVLLGPGVFGIWP